MADHARQPEGDPQPHLKEALRRKERRAAETESALARPRPAAPTSCDGVTAVDHIPGDARKITKNG
jgi:hypothetical protein